MKSWINLTCLRRIATAITLLPVASCDYFEPDTLQPENQVVVGQTEYYILPGTSAVIDLRGVVRDSYINALVKISKQPARGNLTYLGEQLYLFEPNSGFTEGKDQFQASIYSNNSVVKVETLTVHLVREAKDLPCGLIAIEDAVQTKVGEPLIVKFLSNDIICDVDVAKLRFSIAKDPVHGTASLFDDSIQYFPEMGYKGRDVMVYKVFEEDSYEHYSYGIITVTVELGQSEEDEMPPSFNPPPPCTNCKIVFVSDRDGNPEIYTCNADGSNITRLTNNPANDHQPAWSPDGTKIAFVSDRIGSYELYVMNADGSNLMRRTYSGGMDPTWSPDGTRIAYSAIDNGSNNIWVVGATSGAPSLLFTAPGWEGQPAWSPDGTKIALVSDWGAFDIVYDIWTINADGTGFTALTGDIFDHVNYVSPSWSPDGKKLAMVIIQEIGTDQYESFVGIMSADGGGFTAIKPSGVAWWSWAPTSTSWSADGTTIVYTSFSGPGLDVSWVAADGSASGTVVTNGWQADWQKHD